MTIVIPPAKNPLLRRTAEHLLKTTRVYPFSLTSFYSQHELYHSIFPFTGFILPHFLLSQLMFEGFELEIYTEEKKITGISQPSGYSLVADWDPKAKCLDGNFSICLESANFCFEGLFKKGVPSYLYRVDYFSRLMVEFYKGKKISHLVNWNIQTKDFIPQTFLSFFKWEKLKDGPLPTKIDVYSEEKISSYVTHKLNQAEMNLSPLKLLEKKEPLYYEERIKEFSNEKRTVFDTQGRPLFYYVIDKYKTAIEFGGFPEYEKLRNNFPFTGKPINEIELPDNQIVPILKKSQPICHQSFLTDKYIVDIHKDIKQNVQEITIYSRQEDELMTGKEIVLFTRYY